MTAKIKLDTTNGYHAVIEKHGGIWVATDAETHKRVDQDSCFMKLYTRLVIDSGYLCVSGKGIEPDDSTAVL